LGAFYFDSSALVKSYVLEVGTPWVRGVRGIIAPSSGNDIHVLLIAHVEVASAVARRRKAGTVSSVDATAILSKLTDDFKDEFVVIDATEPLLRLAASLVDKHELRAYDGIHLAAVLQVNQVRVGAGLNGITLVSADQELNAAAMAEGLTIEDPNSHP